jgi:hypothetical protein
MDFSLFLKKNMFYLYKAFFDSQNCLFWKPTASVVGLSENNIEVRIEKEDILDVRTPLNG